jgi:hypothetical protein
MKLLCALLLTLAGHYTVHSFVMGVTRPNNTPMAFKRGQTSSLPSSTTLMALEEVEEKDLYPPTNPDQPAWRKGDLDGMDAPINEVGVGEVEE